MQREAALNKDAIWVWGGAGTASQGKSVSSSSTAMSIPKVLHAFDGISTMLRDLKLSGDRAAAIDSKGDLHILSRATDDTWV
jgi:hypothetical protein